MNLTWKQSSCLTVGGLRKDFIIWIELIGVLWAWINKAQDTPKMKKQNLQMKFNIITGFEISLIRSSETSKNDSRTSGIPAGLVRRMTAYFWFSHKLHQWLYIFQTSEWYIRTSDFYNPLARRTSAFNLKFRSVNNILKQFCVKIPPLKNLFE